MDAGSFLFEWHGIRWSLDPGNQDYNTLEQLGFDLWSRCQTCDRWKLLTKNNFGHSTLTVNRSLHQVDGFAPITNFSVKPYPTTTIDLSAPLGESVEHASRTFESMPTGEVVITDSIRINEQTPAVTWQWITQADIEITGQTALLRQSGKEFQIRLLSPAGATFTTVTLDPPPLTYDKKINGLKRLEIRIPSDSFANGMGLIKVEAKGITP